MFKLTIKTDNAAFDDSMLWLELARILRDIAMQLENQRDEGKCRDINGNTVGWFEVAR